MREIDERGGGSGEVRFTSHDGTALEGKGERPPVDFVDHNWAAVAATQDVMIDKRRGGAPFGGVSPNRAAHIAECGGVGAGGKLAVIGVIAGKWNGRGRKLAAFQEGAETS